MRVGHLPSPGTESGSPHARHTTRMCFESWFITPLMAAFTWRDHSSTEVSMCADALVHRSCSSLDAKSARLLLKRIPVGGSCFTTLQDGEKCVTNSECVGLTKSTKPAQSYLRQIALNSSAASRKRGSYGVVTDVFTHSPSQNRSGEGRKEGCMFTAPAAAKSQVSNVHARGVFLGHG